MSDIPKALELYELMSSRMEQSNLAPYQARVYREMRELIQDSSTFEQAQERIQNSGYYCAPAIALIEDRITALKRAAEQNNMPDLANVYANKLSQIEADENTAYETGYEQKAVAIWRRNNIMINAFIRIFNQYCAIASAVADENEVASYRQDLVNAFMEIEAVGGNFTSLAANPTFRMLVCATGQEYHEFVKGAQIYRTSPPDISKEKAQSEAELNAIWGSAKANEQRIKSIGKQCKERTRRAQCIVIPPSNAEGKYEYTDVQEEAF